MSFTQLDGKRALRQFAEESAASEETRLKAAQPSSGKVEAAEVDRSDRDLLVALYDLCGEIPPLAALQEWKKARDLAGGQIIAAAEQWAVRDSGSLKPIAVSAAVDDFISSKQKAG